MRNETQHRQWLNALHHTLDSCSSPFNVNINGMLRMPTCTLSPVHNWHTHAIMSYESHMWFFLVKHNWLFLQHWTYGITAYILKLVQIVCHFCLWPACLIYNLVNAANMQSPPTNIMMVYSTNRYNSSLSQKSYTVTVTTHKYIPCMHFAVKCPEEQLHVVMWYVLFWWELNGKCPENTKMPSRQNHGCCSL